jgi:hypothetical protein
MAIAFENVCGRNASARSIRWTAQSIDDARMPGDLQRHVQHAGVAATADRVPRGDRNIERATAAAVTLIDDDHPR